MTAPTAALPQPLDTPAQVGQHPSKHKLFANREARRRRRSEGRWGVIFAAPQTLGIAFFTLVPIGVAVVMSLFDWPMIGAHHWVGLGNFDKLFSDPSFLDAIANTVLYVAMYLVGNLVVSLGMAAWLTPRIRHRQVFRVIFFIPAVTPGVANAVVWRLIYQPNGLIDASSYSLFGVHAPNFLADPRWAMAAIVVMSVWQGFGYNMLVFSAALDAVPSQLLEAAALDGAGSWRLFWRIKLPLITPSLFFASTMTLITSFQVFAQPFIMTKGGPGDSTSTLVYYIYSEGFNFQKLGLASAAACVLFVIILGITAVQFLGEKKWVHYE